MARYFKIIIALFVFCVFHQTLCAQQKKSLESLLTETNMLVYNNPELAIKNGLQYYKEAKDNPSLQISYLLIVANSYAVLKNHEKVFEYALKAKDIADKNDDKINQIKVLGFLGGQYQRLKLKDKATEYIDKAYTIANQHPLPDSLNYLKGNILFVKGLIQKDDLGCEYALKYFIDAAEILKKYSGKKSTIAGLTIIYTNIGGCYLQENNLAKAEENFNNALHFATIIKSKKSIANAQIGLSEVLTAQNKPKEAIDKIKLILPLLEEVEDIALKKDAYKALSENYLKIKDNKNYEFYTKAYLAEEKKLVDLENKSLNKVVNDVTHASDKSQENQKQNYTFLLLFLGIILIAVISFIYYKLSLKKKNLTELKNSAKKGGKKE